MSRDESALLDMARFAREIVAFTQDFEKMALFKDVRAQYSMLYLFIVLGEAVKRLSGDFRSLHSEIPWRSAAGMRDHIVHEYDRIDFDVLYDAATIDVPLFLEAIEALLPSPQVQGESTATSPP
jgi:uncharacterized protein with HEPN domain